MSRDYESFTPSWHTRPENPADGQQRPAVVLPADLTEDRELVGKRLESAKAKRRLYG